MRSSWFKWMLIVAALFVASGNAHAHIYQAKAEAEACSVLDHHAAHHKPSHGGAAQDDCCCSCFNCPTGLVAPHESVPILPVAYTVDLAPARASPLASLSPSPELDPPRPSALS